MLKIIQIPCGRLKFINNETFTKVRGSQSEQNIEDIMNANNLSSQEMSVKSVPTTPAEEIAPNL